MDLLSPAFKVVSIVFAFAAVGTGAQAIIDPVGFSKGFGLVLDSTTRDPTKPRNDHDRVVTLTESYISLMGVRQLATGIILLTFAFQHKWIEIATILAIIGFLVAGTDGIYLSRGGARRLGQVHAIPGAIIALLAVGMLYSEA